MCFGQWGILNVSEFGGFVLRSVIFFFKSFSFGNDWAILGLLLPGHCFFVILYEPVSVLRVLDSLLQNSSHELTLIDHNVSRLKCSSADL